MALVIRLTRVGKKGESKYRVIVKEKRDKRDGKAVEILGTYNKISKIKQEKKVDMERVKYWISVGALPSPTVKKILNI